MKGLVVVNPDDVKSALKVFENNRKELEKIFDTCKYNLTEQWNQLSAWKRFWNDHEWKPKWKLMLKVKGHDIYSSDWFGEFKEEGMVDAYNYERLKSTYYWKTSHTNVSHSLKQMVKAGSELYLTPTQAEFVNTFKGENNIKGLFTYSYNCYEWEYLVCVSDDESLLVERYNKEVGDDYEDTPLVICDKTHSILADKEEYHYMIKEVEVL